MFLAFNTILPIHVLVARAVFLEAAVLLISDISSSDTRENELGLLPLYLCFVVCRRKVKWIDQAENLCQMYVDFSYAYVP